jgi:hypothetical protein
LKSQKGKRLENITILKNPSLKPIRNRILVGTPTLGIIRAEWAQARFGQVIPCNWTAANFSVGYNTAIPFGYLVADAQNIIVDLVVQQDYEWVVFLEDDVVIPVDTFLKFNEYMKKGDIPVISGLYFLKNSPSEPLVYRGRGNSCYSKFKIGQKVWADGVPTGCLLIHGSILKLMAKESEEYVTGNGQKVKKVFETPAKVWMDPETNNLNMQCGTSDLAWCDRVIKENVLRRAGWKKIAKEKYPFLVDTKIFCKHIELNTGVQWP